MVSSTACTSLGLGDDQEEVIEDDFEPEDTLPHPIAPTPWALKTLILGHQQPPVEEVQNCQAEIQGITADSESPLGLLSAKDQLVPGITEHPNRYHWCFYQMMNALDLEMEKVGVEVGERANLFNKQMTRLWVMARALDEGREVERYFSYVRSRYLNLSQEYFGRSLTIIGPGVNSLPEEPPPSTPEDHDEGWSAGFFD